MSVTTTTVPGAVPAAVRPPLPAGLARLRWAVVDTLTVTKRNLIALRRTPEALFFSTLQPIMFVLLFRYVFGGAINAGPHLSYIDYLMAGIFVQSVAFGGIGSAVGLSEDLHKGLIERFRALPFVAGALLVLALSYALLWGFAFVGLVASNSETAQVIAFPILFPLIFASPAFVRAQSMPGWLRAFATHQPLGVVIDATRALQVGPRAGLGPAGGLVLESLAWVLGMLAVFVSLAVWRYRRST